jgi:hypothetical protein
MTPKEYKQMMDYLTRSGVRKQVKFASDIARPDPKPQVKEIELFNEFNKRNLKADGGRIGFMKGELVTQGPNAGKVRVKGLTLIKDKEGKIIKRRDKFFKDMETANAAIKKHKEGKFGALKYKKSKKILNDPKLKAEFLKYAMSKNVTGKMIRKKYGLTNDEFFYGGLREIIDKDFLQYSKSQPLKSKTIKNMLLLHNNKLSKDFIRNGLIVPDNIIEQLGLDISEASTATARLSQHYSGQDFGFKELKKIKRNKKAGDKLFDEINKFQFGNPYRSNLYKISLQLIDDQLGNERGTFESLKNQARYIIKKNKIKGFDINEIAGVTGTARTGVGEFSQFIDVMDSNLNQKQMASFQSAFSQARQNIMNNPNIFATESKRINKLAGIFEREYGVKLPRIRSLNEVEKFYSPKRLKELADQGLDIKAASKKLGYTIQMPRGSQTIQEFVGDKKIQDNILKNLKKTGTEGFIDLDLFRDVGRGAGAAFKALPTLAPTAALTAGFGIDPTSAIDRATLATEAAFAPGLVQQAAKFSPAVQRVLNLGLSPQLALRAARIASPIGIASLGAEGLYQAGKFTRDRIRELQAMTPEQRQELRSQGARQAFDPFQAAGGGLAKQAGDSSGPPPEKGPMSQGLPGLLKRVKKL